MSGILDFKLKRVRFIVPPEYLDYDHFTVRIGLGDIWDESPPLKLKNNEFVNFHSRIKRNDQEFAFIELWGKKGAELENLIASNEIEMGSIIHSDKYLGWINLNKKADEIAEADLEIKFLPE